MLTCKRLFKIIVFASMYVLQLWCFPFHGRVIEWPTYQMCWCASWFIALEAVDLIDDLVKKERTN